MTRQLEAALAALLLVAGAAVAAAQEPVPAPAPAPAVDSNTAFIGDWDYTANVNDSQIEGAWRLNYANGRFTGSLVVPNNPPVPVSSVSVSNHFRNISITVYVNGEAYVFAGRLDNPQNINGTLTTRGGVGRMRARRRG